MADICVVCNEDLDIQSEKRWYPISDIRIHDRCHNVFKKDPELYGGVIADLDFDLNPEEAEAKEKAEEEQAKQDETHLNRMIEQSKIDAASLQEINDKSVYIKDLDIPFKSMVFFMVKWAIASIPALIILAIIVVLFITILTSLGLAIL